MFTHYNLELLSQNFSHRAFGPSACWTPMVAHTARGQSRVRMDCHKLAKQDLCNCVYSAPAATTHSLGIPSTFTCVIEEVVSAVIRLAILKR